MSQPYKYSQAMIIDDSELDNLVTKVTMERAHFARNIYMHSSGTSALECLTNLGKNRELYSSVFPEVIFVDLNMPNMGGFQFLSYYKASAPTDVPQPRLVVLTSSINPDDADRVRAIDPDIIYMRKPLRVEMLADF